MVLSGDATIHSCGLLRGFSLAQRAYRIESLWATKKLQLIYNSHEAKFYGTSRRVTLITRPAYNRNWTESDGPMAGYMECILELAQKEVLLG